MFDKLQRTYGPHSIDRFASANNALLPRYNSAWRDPGTEAVDALHLPDSAWQRENNWCNPPWPLLPTLVLKLRQSGAAATIVAPHWPGQPWHQSLRELCGPPLLIPAQPGLFHPGRLALRGPLGPPRWPVAIVRHPFRPGPTSAAV
jgi:hypothetical protein